ncbi:TrbC/VirB2 family protein [Cupriavidus numazuensis]|uniref:Prepilin n=1 Tax=Cupriavidus numazuensis TaxID=221992 RepID=A0ABN7Q3D7_9BURK|nr:TrbC/VirB2 family protein [Cupriavidus numazuensis]CAG2155411.1 hypothetical protein LMG26411_04933 [Cupriavidus numazuensis]
MQLPSSRSGAVKLRETFTSALLLAAMASAAGPAHAQTAGPAFLDNLGNFICGIATFINTKYLFVAGLILIVLGAIGIANSESTIMKFVSVICIGVGIAASAPSIMKALGVASACTGIL